MSTQPAQQNIVPGEVIPIPEDFPVTWDDPEDERLLWQLDGVHYPQPMALLEYELMAAIYVGGAVTAMRQSGVPIDMKVRRINGYLYRAMLPGGAPPDGVIRLMNRVRKFAPGLVDAVEAKAIAKLADQYMPNMDPVVGDLASYWHETLLPEIKGYLARWEAFDLEGASMAALAAHLDDTVGWAKRIGVIHYLIFGPYALALGQFDELHKDLFSGNGSGATDAFASYRLLQGFDTLILAGDRMLWELSRKALTMPAVHRVLEETAAADVVAALQETAVGQVFLQEIDAFLKEHGYRGAMFSAIGEASWIEDPTPVIKNLKDYVTQPDRDMLAELAGDAAERERLVAAARAALTGYPRPVVAEFDRLLKAAQTAIVLHSDHGYWIDYRAMYHVRRVLLACGRRLAAAGILDDAADVLLLTLEELRSAMAAPGQTQLDAVVASRKAEMDRFAAMEPPAMLGTLPLMAPPTGDPLMSALAKLEGSVGDAAENRANGAVRGSAGSPGKARGPAKVVHSLAEAEKLAPGDILVAETTAPPWTPLFATAAAVVTDTGGILSHCAVVAREYRIPAVVGTANATEIVQDGQMIEVDGDAGVVRIL